MPRSARPSVDPFMRFTLHPPESPLGAGARMHFPVESQSEGATQSLTVLHVALQLPLLSHLYGAQSAFLPSAPIVVWSPSQVALVASGTQAPEPLQMRPLHSFRGSMPCLVAPQVPSAPDCLSAAVHAWQSPLHAVSQQMPSTQLALAHSRHAPGTLQFVCVLHAAASGLLALQVPSGAQ